MIVVIDRHLERQQKINGFSPILHMSRLYCDNNCYLAHNFNHLGTCRSMYESRIPQRRFVLRIRQLKRSQGSEGLISNNTTNAFGTAGPYGRTESKKKPKTELLQR